MIPSDRPMIFWDTCGILKIFHILDDPDEYSKTLFDNFEFVANKIKSNELTSVTSELVLLEISQHIQQLKNDVVGHQQSVKNNVKVYNHLTSNTTKKARIDNAVDLLQIENRLSELFHCIMKRTYVLKEDSQFNKQAHFRLKNKIAPAHKKSEYKDCYIWLSFVEVARTLPSTKTIFFTDNTKDFFTSGNCPVSALTDDLHDTQGELICKISQMHAHLSH